MRRSNPFDDQPWWLDTHQSRHGGKPSPLESGDHRRAQDFPQNRKESASREPGRIQDRLAPVSGSHVTCRGEHFLHDVVKLFLPTPGELPNLNGTGVVALLAAALSLP
jgi:hypothetical protein